MNRHPIATFSAPKADFVAIVIASKPDRATDGNFLSENIVTSDLLTDAEIQAGRWEHDAQLDPGTYYVLLQAMPDFDACWNFDATAYDPSCADGYSNLATLVIPTPASRYTASVSVSRSLRQITLRLTATPLGIKMPYRVCYTLKSRAQRCLTGTLSGYSWNSSATSELTLRIRGLRLRTTFTWFVGSKRVASRTVRTA